jgi:hypothetical protein
MQAPHLRSNNAESAPSNQELDQTWVTGGVAAKQSCINEAKLSSISDKLYYK